MGLTVDIKTVSFLLSIPSSSCCCELEFILLCLDLCSTLPPLPSGRHNLPVLPRHNLPELKMASFLAPFPDLQAFLSSCSLALLHSASLLGHFHFSSGSHSLANCLLSAFPHSAPSTAEPTRSPLLQSPLRIFPLNDSQPYSAGSAFTPYPGTGRARNLPPKLCCTAS